ncbi:MAG: hypothetical protein GEU80_16155 [Dehalococcoidia bacterium]|nr:hypothetical protein [Dehalococcoidia bacterium]
MIRLYLDEDLSTPLLLGLRARSIDVLSAVEANQLGRSDAEQLAFAAAQGRAICTGNRSDYARLHSEYLAASREHAGIVIASRYRSSVGNQVRALTRLDASLTEEDLRDQIVFLKAWL